MNSIETLLKETKINWIPMEISFYINSKMNFPIFKINTIPKIFRGKKFILQVNI